MLQYLEKYQKLLVTFCLIAFIWVGFLGATYSAFNMQMKADGTMVNLCPFMGQTEICNMSTLEHIGTWQTMFSSLPAQATIVHMLLALVLLSVVFFIHTNQSLFSLDNQIQFHRRRYRENNLYIPFSNNLQRALAKGKINSKAY